MKKGFTLIELLAVIVILAIIALIATPIVLNIIADTRESAKIRSAELYIDSVEQAIIRKKMNGDISFNPSSCTITSGVITCDGESIQVEADGTLPSDGSITLNNGKVEYYDLKFDDKYVVYENGEHTLQDQVIKLDGTYKLKNEETWNVLATQKNINNVVFDPGIYCCDANIDYYVVVLNDGSEWYLSGPMSTSSDTVRLISKYNYFVSGPKIGEMDPSGALNPIAAFSSITEETEETCDCLEWEEEEVCYDECEVWDDNYENCLEYYPEPSCNWEYTCLEEDCYEQGTGSFIYGEDYISPLISNYIEPKLVSSLGITSSDVRVFVPEGSYESGMVEDMFLPSFWMRYDACFGTYGELEYCNDPTDATYTGVKVEIILDKSNVKAILSKDHKIDRTLGIYYDNDLALSFTKIGETETSNIYLAPYHEMYDDYAVVYDLRTGKVIGSASDSNFIVSSLGYPYVGEHENGMSMYDVSIDLEGIDNQTVRGIIECDNGLSTCYTTLAEYCAILMRIPKQ